MREDGTQKERKCSNLMSTCFDEDPSNTRIKAALNITEILYS
jgi:hypothetical protein